MVTGFQNLSGLPQPSQKFSNLFNAYAKAFNKRYDRTGSLFQRPFGRVEIASQAQLFHLVIYIHRNPERHGLVGDFQDWLYSSYHALVTGAGKSHLERDEVIGWYGTINSFKQVQQEDIELETNADVV
jgi:putative transposase